MFESDSGLCWLLPGVECSTSSTLLDSRLNILSGGAYVMQDNMLYPMLTVEETLMFAAEFQLFYSLPKSNKKMRVQAFNRQKANNYVGQS
ncbi:hypothetical protein V6N13_125596 [Hibiscus sabdariffa]